MEHKEQNSMESSGSMSSEPSDSEMDVEEEGFLKQLEEINARLKVDPYAYDSYTSKITLLKKLGDLDELRRTRETLSRLYPLSPSLWLNWLMDERALVVIPEDKEKLNLLFERAVNDYTSVEVWNEYIQFNLESEEEEKVERCREIFERAINAVGHHLPMGHIIWNSYREFEYEISEVTKKKDKYISICVRQLSTPLRGMEETFELLKSSIGIERNTEQYYQHALKKRDLFEKWETYLAGCSDDSSKVKVYMKYIEAVDREGDGQQYMSCLYERAVCDCPLDASIWMDYLNKSRKLVAIEKVVSIGERASRNCPWALSIWIKYFEAIEESTKSKDIMKEVFEKALVYCTTGEQTATLWLKYIEFLRRRITYDSIIQADVELFLNTTEAAETHLLQLLSEPSEYILEVLMYRARVQAHIDKSMACARQLWKEIFSRGYGCQLNVWIQYYNLEVLYGGPKFVRKCIEKGMEIVQDSPRTILDLWINFERDFGDISSMKRCEDALAKWISSNTQNFDSRRSKPKIKSSLMGRNSGEPMPKKSKVTEVENHVAKGNAENNIVPGCIKDSQRVFLSNLDYSAGEDEIRSFLSSCGAIVSVNVVRDYKGKSKGFAYVSFESDEHATLALAKDREPILGRATYVSKCNSKARSNSAKLDTIAAAPQGKNFADKSKIFVKGLAPSKSVDQVKDIFGKFGEIRDVRLVTFRNGVSKGIAFVEFVDAGSVSTAVSSTNGLVFDGSKITVSACNPQVRGQGIMNSTERDSEAAVRRTQKPFVFVPRALKVRKESPGIPRQQLQEGKPLSNQDFRKLFTNDP